MDVKSAGVWRLAVALLAALAAPWPGGPAIAAERSAKLVAAGDVGCRPGQAPTPTSCRAPYTAGIVQALDPDVVALLGDAQDGRGTLRAFYDAYDPWWGRFRPITRPALGNHEYLASSDRMSADVYFAYFGASAGAPGKGYYSYELAGWRVIVLNSGTVDRLRVSSRVPDDCFPVSCAAKSGQLRWLRGVLRRDPPRRCVLAYWHIPRYSSGLPGGAWELRHAYRALYEHGAELVLSAHAHDYERFAPMDASNRVRRVGVQQLVVGTGGAEHFKPPAKLKTGSRFFDRSQAFGVLDLNLRPGRYSFRFLREDGKTLDRGRGRCHGKPPQAKPKRDKAKRPGTRKRKRPA